jgi:hypothetical protein
MTVWNGYNMLPSKYHLGEGKIMEIVKRSMGARRRDEIDKGEERKSGRTGFSGQ